MPPAGAGGSKASGSAGTVCANPGGGTSCAAGTDTNAAGIGRGAAGVDEAGAAQYDTAASRANFSGSDTDGVGGAGRQEKGVTGSRLSSSPDAPSAPAVRNAGTAGVGTSMTGGDDAAGNGATHGAGGANGAGAGDVAAVGNAGFRSAPEYLGAVDCTLRSAAPSPEAAAGAAAGAAEAAAGAVIDGWAGGGGAPQARSASAARATGAGGGRISVSDTSGNNDGGADGSKCADASNTSLHWPQRTHPSDMRNWSATTLKEVAQDGQRVIWLISGGL